MAFLTCHYQALVQFYIDILYIKKNENNIFETFLIVDTVY